MAVEGGGNNKVLTFLTGRYGELRFAKKYDGERPGLVGVAEPYIFVGEPFAEPA